jgi:hypothetical protein
VDSSCGFEGCLPDSPASVFLDSVVGAVTYIQLSIIRDISAFYTAAPQTTQVCITLTLIYMVKISVYAAVYPSVYSEDNFKYTLRVMALKCKQTIYRPITLVHNPAVQCTRIGNSLTGFSRLLPFYVSVLVNSALLGCSFVFKIFTH